MCAQEWQWQLGVFTVFFAWMNFLLFLRRLPRIGIYVVMIVEILKTFLRFFAIFFLFIVAFAICFTILLKNQVGLLSTCCKNSISPSSSNQQNTYT